VWGPCPYFSKLVLETNFQLTRVMLVLIFLYELESSCVPSPTRIWSCVLALFALPTSTFVKGSSRQREQEQLREESATSV
jgi:hypothetical protein